MERDVSEENLENLDDNENKSKKTDVDPNVVEQYKNDMFKFKREARDMAEKNEALAKKIQEIENAKLESQGEYRKLYEEQLQKTEQYESKYKDVLGKVVEDKKVSAVRELAMKRNIRPEALEDLNMIDMSGVIVETTDQGRYSVLGADSFVEKLQSAKPHWFTDSKAPNVNNGTGDFDGKEKTYSSSEVLELQKKDPAKYREIMTKQRHLIRS
jgi:DNA repair ATPase RecN